MLQLFCKCPEGKGFCFGHGLSCRCSVSHGTREFNHLGQPTPIIFLLNF